MAELRPMSDFDPSKPATVYDERNKQFVPWDPAWEKDYRIYCKPGDDGTTEFGGLRLTGWLPSEAAQPASPTGDMSAPPEPGQVGGLA